MNKSHGALNIQTNLEMQCMKRNLYFDIFVWLPYTQNSCNAKIELT